MAARRRRRRPGRGARGGRGREGPTRSERTPEMLPVLKEAGVVDAGGTGFLLLLDVLLHVVDGRPVPEPTEVEGPVFTDPLPGHGDDGEHGDISDLRYEVMYFLEAPDDAIPAFKDVWAGIGDSIVVVGRRRHLELPHPHRRHRRVDRGRHRHRHAPQDPRHRPHRAGGGGALGPRGRRARRRSRCPSDLRTPVTCAVVAVATGDGHPPHLPLARRAGHRHRRPVDEPVDRRAARGGRGGAGRPGRDPARTTRTSSRWPSRSTPTPTKTVHVVPTKGITEGFAALVAYDPEADGADNAEEMAERGRQRRRRRGHPGRARLELRRRARSPRATGSASPATASARSRPSSATPPPSCSPSWCYRRHEIVTIIEGDGSSAPAAPATSPSGSASTAPPPPPRSTTAASRSTRTSSASSSAASGPAADLAELPTSRSSRGWARSGPRRSTKIDIETVLDLSRTTRGATSTRRSSRRSATCGSTSPAWVFGQGRVVHVGARAGAGQGAHGAPDHRRLRLPAHHVLQPAVAHPPAPRGLRGDVLRQGHRVPGPAADGEPGDRPARRGRPAADRRRSTRSPTSCGSTRRTSAAGWRSRCAARSSSSTRCRAGCSTSTTSSTAPRRSAGIHQPETMARGRGGAAPARVRRAAPHPARARAAQAPHRGDEPGHRARRRRARWSSGSSDRAAVRAHRRPAAGDRRDHRRPGPPDPDAPAAAGRRRRGQDRRRRRRAAHRGAGRPPGRVHGAHRGARRAALREHAAAARGHHRARRRRVAVRRAPAHASSCSPTGSPARSASGCSTALAAGEVDLLVGTHALIQEAVEFRSLGVVVIDEQHRFGVEQRAALRDKAGGGAVPDVLVMTATPIPRTAAMTVYGDLDVSVLGEKPAGRQPIVTTLGAGRRRGGGGVGARSARRSPPAARPTSCARSSGRARSSRSRSARGDLRPARGRRAVRPAARAAARPAARRRRRRR